jgi:D-alanyl-D-alanine carboxypeptidase
MLKMMSKERFVALVCVVQLIVLLPGVLQAKQLAVNAKSAILVDMSSGEVIFEQNADAPIPPASITKILTLYLVFDAMRQGRVHPWDKVEVSKRAAKAQPTRMGLKAGQHVPLEEIIKGLAVVSGNDAAIAVAEHLSGSVEGFVAAMNTKARQLGMSHSIFMTPNGLPAKGQLTTARDIATLSIAYLHRFPESLAIHSMRTYTYDCRAHRNANRLLGKCPGVDGIKTGFVCASGYNLSATAKRDNERLIAVVLGAPSPGIRAAETTKLLEMGFQKMGVCTPEIREVQVEKADDDENQTAQMKRFRITGTGRTVKKTSAKVAGAGGSGRAGVHGKTKVASSSASLKKNASSKSAPLQSKDAARQSKTAKRSVTAQSTKTAAAAGQKLPAKQSKTAGKSQTSAKTQMVASAAMHQGKAPAAAQNHIEKKGRNVENSKTAAKSASVKKSGTTPAPQKTSGSKQVKQAAHPSNKKNCTQLKPHPQAPDPKEKRG